MKRTSWCAITAVTVIGMVVGCEPVETSLPESVDDETLATSAEAQDIVWRIQRDFWSFAPEEEPGSSAPLLRPSAVHSLVRRGSGWSPSPETLRTEDEEARIVDVWMGETAIQGFEVRDEASGIGMHVRLEGTTDTAAQLVDGFLVYPASFGDADVVFRPAGNGVEDFILLADAPSQPELRYHVTLNEDVAGLRLVGRTLELLEESGMPRLRMAPPFLQDAEGTARPIDVVLEGCAADTDPRAPWNRPVTRAGSHECTVVLSWDDRGLSYPALVDPTWTDTGTMGTPRQFHGAQDVTASASCSAGDQCILVAGGVAASGTTDTAEIWTSDGNNAGAWTPTDSMDDSRYGFGIATVTDGTDTWVLAAGGNGNCSGTYCNVAERWDFSDGTWYPTANNMSSRRFYFPLVVLTDGSGYAFASGGLTAAATVTSSAEEYNPATNSWSSVTPTLATARYGHEAVALSATNSSKVVIQGGRDGSANFLSSAELYNPAGSGSFSSAGPLMGIGAAAGRRLGHTLILYPNDTVLAIGGQDGNTTCLFRPELYTPSTDAWTGVSATGGPSSVCYHAASLLESGDVLVTGGKSIPTSSATLNVYLRTGTTWSSTTAMKYERMRHTSTRYVLSGGNNDRVLQAGGINGSGYPSIGEYFTP